VGVPVFDPAADVGFQLVDGVVVAALQQVLGDVGEEPFDLVDPAGIRWGEVHLEPRVGGEPGFHDGTFGESPEGVSPSGARRTVRDSLPSYGSHRSG